MNRRCGAGARYPFATSADNFDATLWGAKEPIEDVLRFLLEIVPAKTSSDRHGSPIHVSCRHGAVEHSSRLGLGYHAAGIAEVACPVMTGSSKAKPVEDARTVW